MNIESLFFLAHLATFHESPNKEKKIDESEKKAKVRMQLKEDSGAHGIFAKK